MKRSISEVQDGLPILKKRRVTPILLSQPSRPVTLTRSPTESLPLLPSEIWEQIMLLLIDKNYYPLHTAAMVSKQFLQTAINELHRHSANKWPKFYEKAMKQLNNTDFLALYRTLHNFSQTKAEANGLEERFESQLCLVCDTSMDQSGSNDEILHCSNCLQKYGANIEWRLEVEEYTCCACDKLTPYLRFTCEECNAEYGMCCGDDYLADNPTVENDGYELLFYCNECVNDCEHCGKYSVFKNETCEECQEYQCSECRRKDCDIVERQWI